ncbi:MAG: hypothetical protein Kow0037_25310 [Calditrichia bacterium]
MKKTNMFSSLNILLDNVEGANLLLEYYADFSERLYGARDFKAILKTFYEELRKIYVSQNIEFVLWQDHARLVKFTYNDADARVVPVEEFEGKRTLYNYVLEKQQVVLTNSYPQFCQNLELDVCDIPASSWLGIPMMVRGKVLGMVAIWDENPERYLRLQDKQFLEGIVNMAAFAIENTYLYDYIVAKNGSYKNFDSFLPMGSYRNSIKSLIAHLLESALKYGETRYTGIFVRSQHHNKWRLIGERYEDDPFKTAGLDLLNALETVKELQLDSGEYLYWHRDYASHPLNPTFRQFSDKFPVSGVILFPFRIESSYYGLWLVATSGKEPEPQSDGLAFYRFVSFLLVQLIEKKALLERKRKYEQYLNHLEKMKTVGELASGSAHHLNNILSVILGKTQLLQKKLKGTPFEKDLRLIEKAASDGALAVKRLQNVSGKDKKDEEFKEVDLNAVVQEVVEIARPRFEREAQSRGIHYDLKLNLGTIYPVKGNAASLREVLLNLVNNGLDAMPHGGQLSIQTTIKEKEVLVFVSDTGIGIPDEIRDRIFEPFFTTKGEKGNGLGLSIAAEVISRHKGKIYVDSIPNKGSIIMLELPASDLKKGLEPSKNEFAGQGELKLLLVDDESVVRETLAEMLEDDGFEVTMARNAEDAVLKFKKYQCDVVLTDLSMPGINGYELARRIKEIDSSVPVFLITGWNQLDRKFMESNKVIDGIVEKPFNIERIRSQIEKFMHKNGYRKKVAKFSL